MICKPAVRRLACALAFSISACHDAAPKPTLTDRRPAAMPFADPLALVPRNSDAVLRIDVAALRHSPIWAKYERQVLQLVAPGIAACGYDPLAELTSITAGLTVANDDGVFIMRGLDRDKTLGCLHSLADDDTTTRFDGEFITQTHKSGAVNMFTFADRTTLLMQGSKHPTKDTLTAAMKMGAPLRDDADYTALASKVPPGAAITFVMPPRSLFLSSRLEPQLGASVHAAYIAVSVTDSVDFRAGIILDSEQQAAALQARVESQLAPARQFVRAAEIRQRGNELELEIALTDDQLAQIGQAIMAGYNAGAAPK